MSFFQHPRYFGIEDHTVGGPNPFQVRVYFPTEDDVIVGAPLPAGPHPLVVFAHGERAGDHYDHLCPREFTRDHRRWTLVLGALARSGFVVAAPQMEFHAGPARVSATIAWMRTQWRGRATLHVPLVLEPGAHHASRSGDTFNAANAGYAATATANAIFPGLRPPVVLGNPTPLALVGHSWGARICAEMLAGGGVKAIALIAGSFDTNESIAGLTNSRVPNFFLCGTADGGAFNSMDTLWQQLPTPKYQAALKEVDHFDWFGRDGAIRRCDGTPVARPGAGQIAGELIAGFLTRHLARVPFEPSHLVRIPLLRPWNAGWSDQGSAIQMRWDAPGEQFGPLLSTGDGILGPWPAGTAPW